MVEDVEKRWHDPRMFRRAATYVASVLATAALVFALILLWAAQRECAGEKRLLCDGAAQAAVVLGPSAVLLIGGIGAFVETYVQWRRGRSRGCWHGASCSRQRWWWFDTYPQQLLRGFRAETIIWPCTERSGAAGLADAVAYRPDNAYRCRCRSDDGGYCRQG